MFTAAIIATVWAILLALLVWGNKRWSDRMVRMDAELEQCVQQREQQRQQQHAAYGRKYS